MEITNVTAEPRVRTMRDLHRAAILSQLDALTDTRLAGGYAPIKGPIDEGTAELVQGILKICQTARDAHGDVRPFFLPGPLAFAFVAYIRSQLQSTTPLERAVSEPKRLTEGLPVPGKV